MARFRSSWPDRATANRGIEEAETDTDERSKDPGERPVV